MRPAPLALLLLVACDSGTPSAPGASPPPPPAAAAQTVRITADAGGVVGREDETSARLTFPAGAVKSDVEVSLAPRDAGAFAAPGTRVLGQVWTCLVDGQEHYKFAKPVRLSLPFDRTRPVPDLSVWKDGGWQPVGGARADHKTGRLTAQIKHFSDYACTESDTVSRDPDDVRKKWTHVKAWHATVLIAVHGSGERGGSDGGYHRYTINHEAQASFILPTVMGELETLAGMEQMKKKGMSLTPQMADQMNKLMNVRHWQIPAFNGTPDDETDLSANIDDTDDIRGHPAGEGGNRLPTIERHSYARGNFTGKAAGAHSLEIDLLKGTWSLRMDDMKAGTATVHDGSKRPPVTVALSVEGAFLNRPLPTEGRVIRETIRLSPAEFDDQIRGVRTPSYDFGSVRGVVMITLSPEPLEEVELVIAPEGYKEWMPRGGADTKTRGNTIKVTTKLQRRGGGTPRDATLKDVEMHLEAVSEEPGVCLNVPKDGGGETTPDLKFGAESDGEVADEGRRVRKNGKFLSVTATVECFDWGASGHITARGTLTDGRPVWGTLEGDPTTELVLLPHRESGSRVADTWKSQCGGGKDNDDNDRQTGNTNHGDGLTVYEEYRGLIVKGKHTRDHGEDQRLTTGRKDLIVDDSKIGSAADDGIKMFESASGINIVRVGKDELATTRQVNPNRGKITVTAQHGLRLIDDPALQAAGATDDGTSPKGVAEVKVNTALIRSLIQQNVRNLLTLNPPIRAPFTAKDHVDQTIAHELAHGVGVDHHGFHDEYPLADLYAYARSTGARLFNRDGSVLNPATRSGDAGKIGRSPCEASGDVECIMCYTLNYQWAYHGSDFYEVPVVAPGRTFCTKPDGTGYNARRRQGADGKPMNGADGRPLPSLFGGARSGQGNCLAAMQVRDP